MRRRCTRRAARLHPEAAELICAQIRETAGDKPVDLDLPENLHRLNMGTVPKGATIIPNSYNRIPGFSVGNIHLVPGFPVMAWPMIEWVLDTKYADLHHAKPYVERSVLVFGLPESRITSLMKSIESDFAGVRVFTPAKRRRRHARRSAWARALIWVSRASRKQRMQRLREGVAALGGKIMELSQVQQLKGCCEPGGSSR